MSETPKSFKDNFTDFAKSLGSSLNIFKQNVQQAISGVNTIAQNNKDSLNLCWKISEDSWGGGDVLDRVSQLNNSTVYVCYNKGDVLVTRDKEEVNSLFNDFYKSNFRQYSTSGLGRNSSISVPDLVDYLEDGKYYKGTLWASFTSNESQYYDNMIRYSVVLSSSSVGNTIAGYGWVYQTGDDYAGFGQTMMPVISPFVKASDYAFKFSDNQTYRSSSVYVQYIIAELTELY